MYNLVAPYFIYCSTVWNDGNKTNLEMLYKMQKRAARTITGFNYETRSKTIFQILGWSPLEKILTKREILITFKAIVVLHQSTSATCSHFSVLSSFHERFIPISVSSFSVLFQPRFVGETYTFCWPNVHVLPAKLTHFVSQTYTFGV